MTGSEDIDFHLFFRNVEYRGYVLIALPFNITKLHTTALFLRQLVDELAHQSDAVALYGLFLGIGMMAIVRGFFSTARLRQTVRQKLSILSIASQLLRLFHTFIIVSCTTSSASAGLRVMRSANLKSLSFSGRISFRKLTMRLYLMTVPCWPSIAVARVMITLPTPASTAFRAFSIFGNIPPDMVPSAL